MKKFWSFAKSNNISGRPRQEDGRVHGVVVAVQREDGRWLCIRRSKFVAAPLKVCFPGGAIEVGETQEHAVIREMREEVGIAVTPIAPCWRWEAPDRPLTLYGWTARLADGSLDALRPDEMEVAEILWLTSQEAVDHPDAIATNREFVACLRQQSK